MPLAVTQTRPSSIEELKKAAHQIRVDSLRMTHAAGSGHPGGSMSEAEILATLYFGGVLQVDPKNPRAPERDRFILSKGHCCPGLYSILSQKGFFPREELVRFRKLGSFLQGHSDLKTPGVEMAAGSLGMGLSFANGVALMGRLEKKSYRVYVLLGDGECQEGNVWEAALTTAHHKLDTVCAIIDHNQIQIEGFVRDIKSVEPLAEKWRAFGWNALEVDGHDPQALLHAYAAAAKVRGRPTIIIANTVKGKGVSFTENKNEYHGRALTDEEMRRAMAELAEPWP